MVFLKTTYYLVFKISDGPKILPYESWEEEYRSLNKQNRRAVE